MAGLVVLLASATLWPATSAGVPTVIAVLAALIAVMLITKPGTGSSRPGLTTFGDAGLALTLCAVGLAFSHVLRLRRT